MTPQDYQDAIEMWKELVSQGLAKPRGYQLAGPCDHRPVLILRNDQECSGNSRLGRVGLK